MKTTEPGVLFSYAIAGKHNALYAEIKGKSSVLFNLNSRERRFVQTLLSCVLLVVPSSECSVDSCCYLSRNGSLCSGFSDLLLRVSRLCCVVLCCVVLCCDVMYCVTVVLCCVVSVTVVLCCVV